MVLEYAGAIDHDTHDAPALERSARQRVAGCRASHDPLDVTGCPRSLDCRLVDIDRYEVVDGATVVGYIDLVGNVFVCLTGPWYSVAVEVGQVLEFDAALTVLREAA